MVILAIVCDHYSIMRLSGGECLCLVYRTEYSGDEIDILLPKINWIT